MVRSEQPTSCGHYTDRSFGSNYVTDRVEIVKTLLLWFDAMATSAKARPVDENTVLKNEQQIHSRFDYGASSHSSIEGLTPSGYEINLCQLCMLGCWLVIGLIPYLAVLIVGFEDVDISCNDKNNYGLIHPRAYLMITGLIGIVVSVVCTFTVSYIYYHNPFTMEMVVNGKLSELPTRNILILKIIGLALIAVSFVWCIIGWFLVGRLNANGCDHVLITQTILGWTIVESILLICAISIPLFRNRQKVHTHDHDSEDKEGSMSQQRTAI
eukprot:601747_1